jgi:release factor glutamine methyltransferase
MTVLEVLTAAAGYLRDRGVESPRLNAEHLLAHVLGKRRLDLYLEFDRPLSESERAPVRALIRERAAGKPLQHLLGTAAFFGRLFLCDSRALVPRPETEQLVDLILKDLRCRNCKMSILDIGTGSGVIAVTLALELPSSEVTATDVSGDALSLALENAARHGVEERIRFHEADLFPPDEARFDCIVANPPYIATSEFASLPAEVLYDPRVALDGGSDGLALIRRLIDTSAERLLAAGILAMEIGHEQAEAVVGQLSSNNYRNVLLHKDYQGIRRFIIASSPEHS